MAVSDGIVVFVSVRLQPASVGEWCAFSAKGWCRPVEQKRQLFGFRFNHDIDVGVQAKKVHATSLPDVVGMCVLLFAALHKLPNDTFIAHRHSLQLRHNLHDESELLPSVA